MLLERMTDQAEGLRRLLVRASTRVVTVAAAQSGLGATGVVVNLATALAQTGKDVLVLDESQSHDNIGVRLALKPRYDLLNVVRREKTLREVVLRSPQGVTVLPVARAIRALPQLFTADRDRLLQTLAEVSDGMDVVLVDAAVAEQDAAPANLISSGLAPDQPLLLVLNATASAITESYALIKRMAMQDGRLSFEVVINRARDEREARLVFDNMAQVARRHLHVRVEYLGHLPVDEHVARATQLCRPVVEAFPSAQSSRNFREMANGLMSLPIAENVETNGLTGLVQRLMRQARTQELVRTI